MEFILGEVCRGRLRYGRDILYNSENEGLVMQNVCENYRGANKMDREQISRGLAKSLT